VTAVRWGLLLLAMSCAGGARSATVVGAARDAKGGAVVVADDGRVLYVDGVDSWPAAISGRRVAVTGRIVERTLDPGPLTSDAGEHRAGATGTQRVIEGARWEPLAP
jgi:hypothetical protein